MTVPEIDSLSHTILWNVAFQAHPLISSFNYLWPELEFNFSHFTGGENVGKNQLFITPGLILGRFSLRERLGLTIGAGVQIAATEFHTYDHAWTFTARLPF